MATEARTRSSPPNCQFGRFELRADERLLYCDGEPARLGGRAFDLLQVLVERRERVVGKDELMDLVWPGLVVEGNNLQVQVLKLRRLLGPAAIATVPGRGYRFTLAPDDADPPAAAAERSRKPGSAVPSAAAHEPQRLDLPLRGEALIGRERELAQVQALLAAERLVTLVGPGGVGKSRLALEAAWADSGRYAGGVYWVDLAPLADPPALTAAAARALGLAAARAAVALSLLERRFAGRDLLIVLDNCEHLVAALAAMLQTLLACAPSLRALATSQEPIGIDGERVLRLPPLELTTEPQPTAERALASAAVRLFVARSHLADPRFTFDDRVAPVVASVCRRLDGLPLALEMAAARMPLLGAEGLAARLGERFRLLTAGKRTALSRHRTLRAALDWSYARLSADEQAVFRRLGVFAGSFALAEVAAVAAEGERDELRVLDILAGLCSKSLVEVEAGEREARCRLLETMRAYALERLVEAGESGAVRLRHAMHCRQCLAPRSGQRPLVWQADARARYAPEVDDRRGANRPQIPVSAKTAAALLQVMGRPESSLTLGAAPTTFAAHARRLRAPRPAGRARSARSARTQARMRPPCAWSTAISARHPPPQRGSLPDCANCALAVAGPSPPSRPPRTAAAGRLRSAWIPGPMCSASPATCVVGRRSGGSPGAWVSDAACSRSTVKTRKPMNRTAS